MQKITSLTGKPVEHCESPQAARYEASQQYRQHVDGFSSHGGATGRKELSFGGNRLVTVLIYLNDVGKGGETHFPYMNLEISPTKGTALVIFPSIVDGEMDVQALHAALPAVDTKYISQVWVRERIHLTGNPRTTPKRLSPEEVAGWSFQGSKGQANSYRIAMSKYRVSTETLTKYGNTNREYLL
jgi:prolyl 4-hydroxylase